MKVGKPLPGAESVYITNEDGDISPRCPVVDTLHGGGQCAKPKEHPEQGDFMHYSDSMFCWPVMPKMAIPETAEDRFGASIAEPPSAGQALADWWMGLAANEIEQTVPKAVEYGSTDLIDIGRNIARLSGRVVSDQEASELGVFFYLEGKFARWRSAIIENRPVSDDTLFDIGVYVRMAQRIREMGSWPGVETE